MTAFPHMTLVTWSLKVEDSYGRLQEAQKWYMTSSGSLWRLLPFSLLGVKGNEICQHFLTMDKGSEVH